MLSKSQMIFIINNICSNIFIFDATEKSIKFYLIFSIWDVFFLFYFSQLYIVTSKVLVHNNKFIVNHFTLLLMNYFFLMCVWVVDVKFPSKTIINCVTITCLSVLCSVFNKRHFVRIITKTCWTFYTRYEI